MLPKYPLGLIFRYKTNFLLRAPLPPQVAPLAYILVKIIWINIYLYNRYRIILALTNYFLKINFFLLWLTWLHGYLINFNGPLKKYNYLNKGSNQKMALSFSISLDLPVAMVPITPAVPFIFCCPRVSWVMLG